MTEANQPPLQQIAGALNLLAGFGNLIFGLVYILLCYGVVLAPIGLWQMVAGGMMLTGKRVPGGFASCVAGVIAAILTCNFFGTIMCLFAAGLAGYEQYGPQDQAPE